MIQSIFNDIPKTKGYSKCKKIERSLANDIYKKLSITSNKKLTFNIPKGTTGQRIIWALMVQHFPYTSELGKWYEVKKLSDGTRDITIDAKTFKKLEEKNQAVRAKIKEIVAECDIKPNTDEYVKAKRLAEYIAEHCSYRYTDDGKGYQAWDCLVNHSAICCGYSEAYKALCDYVNLRCQCVTSYDHQWNRVNVNGKWFNVDVCWVSMGASKKDYLITDDKTFFRDHMPYKKKMAQYWKYKE